MRREKPPKLRRSYRLIVSCGAKVRLFNEQVEANTLMRTSVDQNRNAVAGNRSAGFRRTLRCRWDCEARRCDRFRSICTNLPAPQKPTPPPPPPLDPQQEHQLERDIVRRVIYLHLNQVRYCYQQSLVRQPACGPS